jgi:hypothetical protein
MLRIPRINPEHVARSLDRLLSGTMLRRVAALAVLGHLTLLYAAYLRYGGNELGRWFGWLVLVSTDTALGLVLHRALPYAVAIIGGGLSGLALRRSKAGTTELVTLLLLVGSPWVFHAIGLAQLQFRRTISWLLPVFIWGAAAWIVKRVTRSGRRA